MSKKQRYHLSLDGNPRLCKATASCPLGSEPHGEFESEQEAKAWAETALSQDNETFVTLSRKMNELITDEKEDARNAQQARAQELHTERIKQAAYKHDAVFTQEGFAALAKDTRRSRKKMDQILADFQIPAHHPTPSANLINSYLTHRSPDVSSLAGRERARELLSLGTKIKIVTERNGHGAPKYLSKSLAALEAKIDSIPYDQKPELQATGSSWTARSLSNSNLLEEVEKAAKRERFMREQANDDAAPQSPKEVGELMGEAYVEHVDQTVPNRYAFTATERAECKKRIFAVWEKWHEELEQEAISRTNK